MKITNFFETMKQLYSKKYSYDLDMGSKITLNRNFYESNGYGSGSFKYNQRKQLKRTRRRKMKPQAR